jgi:hypothetical protein
MITMRVHTDLTRDQVRNLTRGVPGVFFHHLSECGSQSRARAFKLVLSGTSPRRGQSTIGDSEYYAATWDQWGIVLGALFEADPDARVAQVYEGADDFHWQTSDRFNGQQITPCPQHRWVFDRVARPGRWAQGVCSYGCGAVKRYQY